jgi:hypothetical protein
VVIAVRSLTVLPLGVGPKKKAYAFCQKVFLGLALDLNSFGRIGILILGHHLLKMGMKKAPTI